MGKQINNLLSPQEVADQIGCSKETILRRIRTGKLSAYKLGSRTYKISQSQIDEFLKNSEMETNKVIDNFIAKL
jgi:excisionase family DNA binding protein